MAVDRNELQRRIAATLSTVRHPGSGADIVTTGHVRELTVDDDGKVQLQFFLRPEDAGSLVREVRSALEAVDGVTKVKIEVKLPQAPQPQRQGHSHAQPQQRPGLKPGSMPAPTPDRNRLAGISHVVAVSSGKGGVGKSTVAANLAAALAVSGRSVGLLDADIYGPDIPLMFGERRKPRVTGAKGAEKMVPLEAHGVRLMSLGFLLEDDQPAIMRGPLISGILRQFLEQVEWGELDYLVVDMPPGTGDAQLSLVQSIDIAGVVMVTTPQEVSTGDVRRAVRMFERVRTPILGVVENMSGFECPHCQGHVDIFGRGGGERLATEMGLDFLGAIPLETQVREAGDLGRPTLLSSPESGAGRAFRDIGERVVSIVEAAPAIR
jgi:ATP-binding protein involved in chromosome partitioning